MAQRVVARASDHRLVSERLRKLECFLNSHFLSSLDLPTEPRPPPAIRFGRFRCWGGFPEAQVLAAYIEESDRIQGLSASILGELEERDFSAGPAWLLGGGPATI